MNKYTVILALSLAFVACQKTGPCAEGGGIYVFPKFPKNSTMTSAEVDQFYDLPKDISQCISTEALVETCLTYPQLSLIDAGSNPQTGYWLVSSKFRGLRELSNREDRGIHLLRKYQTTDPLGYNPNGDLLSIGRYVLRFSYLEVILSQEKTLESLSWDQKIKLIERARTVYEKKEADTTHQDLYSLAKTSAIMARLMRLDGYQPFVNIYRQTDWNWNFVSWYWSTDYATARSVYTLSTNYLNFLKQQR